MDELLVRDVALEHAQSMCDIYNYYVEHSSVTFEEGRVELDEMRERIDDVISCKSRWIVAERKGVILGYAYAVPWRKRSAYRFTAETSVYVDPKSSGKGIGSKLYENLIEWSKENNIHSLISVVSLPNNESVVFHEKFGFEKVAHLKEAGLKFDNWVDVGYWQKVIV